jgi:hypothetical protein
MVTRNRKIDYRTVPANTLIPNPLNWRVHPDGQRSALEEVMAEVGDVDVLKVVETPDGLMLLDGHLRSEIAGDADVEVVVLDLDENEQRLILAAFDPIGAMAQSSQDNLMALLEQIETEQPALNELFEAVANDYRALEFIPEFEPVGIDQQGELDKIKNNTKCPECGHEFTSG